MSGSVVVDASLAVKWLVEEDDSDKAHAALQSWVAQDITRIAPHLMPFEVANALHRRVLRGELNVGDSIRMIARLLASRLELHQPPGLHVRALQLASQLKQNAAYDAHYLALAESVGCELWTADERFVLPRGKPKHWQRALDRRVRCAGVADRADSNGQCPGVRFRPPACPIGNLKTPRAKALSRNNLFFTTCSAILNG